MPTYQGLVANVTDENKAEILITPGDQSIPGAPEVSKKVCHKASEGSTLKIDAVNRAGAEVGDWVSLSRPSGILKRNVMALLGMPFLAGITGTLVGLVSMFAVGLPMASLAVCAAIGLLMGMLVGGKRYRALSEQNQPVINRIVKKRAELDALCKEAQGSEKQRDGTCDLCSGCVGQ
jgi:hypothetical protein